MDVYHEIPHDTRGAVLEKGLLCASRGDKGDDGSIIKTDRFLDQRCPQDLKQRGISRDNNVYAYVPIENTIIDITSGEYVPMAKFISSSNETVLRLNVDVNRCFVSDLDTYDRLKEALSNNKKAQAEELAHSYWSKIIPLSSFHGSEIRRPEIMITYNIPPTRITVCN